jgi:hypothetical protein
VEGHGVRPWPQNVTSVPFKPMTPGPLAAWAGPDPARAPGAGIAALPPLALGGAGGHALMTHFLIFVNQGLD